MSFEYRPMRSVIYVDCVKEEYRHRLQRWLYYTHVPDSINKFAPYCNKYTFYNALPVPPEAQILPGHGDFSTFGQEVATNFYIRNALRNA